MPRHLLTVVAALATAVVAQQPATPKPHAAAGERLHKALVAAAGATDVAYRIRWGADAPPAGEGGTKSAPVSEAGGSWHADRVHLRLGGKAGDEFVMNGRRTIARDAQRPWAQRRGRLADGTTLRFLPDPTGLLAFLADQELAVGHADVGAIEDRPVEVVTATLTPEQVAEATWSGLLPAAFTTVPTRLTIAGAGAGDARAPEPAPTADVDVAVHFDPALGVVRRVHVRCWLKPEIQRGNRIALRFNADGRPERVDESAVEEDEQANAEAAKLPLRHADGLPLRPRRGLLVSDVVLDLGEPGKTPAPALDERAAKLLAR